MLPIEEHILTFNSSPYKDVAFSGIKIHLDTYNYSLKSWFIDKDTNILRLCDCPFIVY